MVTGSSDARNVLRDWTRWGVRDGRVEDSGVLLDVDVIVVVCMCVSIYGVCVKGTVQYAVCDCVMK